MELATALMAAKTISGLLGVKVSVPMDKLLEMANKTLAEKYNFSRPKKFPRLGFATFESVDTKTVGARQFVLEKGIFRGKYWRIREKVHPFSTHYFVWDTFEESQALELWVGFVSLVEAKTILSDYLGT